ncbi:MAG: HTTM domain-containing protein [Myxococcota bacterium]|nr:HTTM domain-containing protein [Myxococcota bacterium]
MTATTRQTAKQRIDRFVFGGIDPIRLDAFRRCISVTLLVYLCDRLMHPFIWLSDAGYHRSTAVQMPSTIPSLPTLPTELVLPFAVFYLAAVIGLIFGWRARLLTWIVLACNITITSIDPLAAYTLNHLYVTMFAVMALATPPREVTTDSGPRSLQSAWPVRIMQASLIVMYFNAGYTKLSHGTWFEDPYTLWSQVQGFYATDLAAWLLRTLPKPTWIALQHIALSFELLAPAMFAVRRLRPLAILWGIGFHLIIALTMYKLFYFSFQMICFYILFMDDAWLHRAAAEWRLRVSEPLRRLLARPAAQA